MEGSSNPNSLPDTDNFFALLFCGEASDDDVAEELQNRFCGEASDENFAEELQLQEVNFSSFFSSQGRPFAQASIASSSKVETTPPKSDTLGLTETGESSRSFCEICMEEKAANEMFENKDCSHVHCNDCISKHIAAKMQENISMVRCPTVECNGLLAPYLCQSLLPVEVMDRWGAALAEAMLLGSQRFYCPFKDCSALLIDNGGEEVRESECPNCRRLFCAQCKVSWHSGVTCEEYQALNPDEKGREDLMVLELAKTEGWRRCSRCKYYVQKTEGCLHMVCRLVRALSLSQKIRCLLSAKGTLPK